MLVWAWKCLEYAGCSRPANSDYSAASSNANSAWARALETDIALVGGPTERCEKRKPRASGASAALQSQSDHASPRRGCGRLCVAI